jgi:hypothetical protein
LAVLAPLRSNLIGQIRSLRETYRDRHTPNNRPATGLKQECNRFKTRRKKHASGTTKTRLAFETRHPDSTFDAIHRQQR